MKYWSIELNSYVPHINFQDKILKLLASEKTMKQKNNSITEMVMPDNTLLALEKKMSGTNDNTNAKSKAKEKNTSLN